MVQYKRSGTITIELVDTEVDENEDGNAIGGGATTGADGESGLSVLGAGETTMETVYGATRRCM